MKWKDCDIQGVKINQLSAYSDKRGWLTEIFRDDEICPGIRPAMAYISVTNPEQTRGPHEHENQTDFFAFVGPGTLKLRMWDMREKSKSYQCRMTFMAGEKNRVSVIIPPGVVHGYMNPYAEPAYVINFPNRLYSGKYKQEKVDEIRHEDITPNPFSFAD